MIETQFPGDFESSLRDDIAEHIPVWESDLRELLPTLPEDFQVDVTETPPSDNSEYLEGGWDYGVGGSTQTPSKMKIEVEKDTGHSRQELLKVIRATYFHEGFHLARGYSFESRNLSLLDIAVEEGLATKFETLHADANPRYGHYGDRDTMIATLAEVREADLAEDKDWQKWKFHDPETDRHWILYRVGTFVADEVLSRNPEMNIEDLSLKSVSEIIELSGL